jgi:hypothetical protein
MRMPAVVASVLLAAAFVAVAAPARAEVIHQPVLYSFTLSQSEYSKGETIPATMRAVNINSGPLDGTAQFLIVRKSTNTTTPATAPEPAANFATKKTEQLPVPEAAGEYSVLWQYTPGQDSGNQPATGKLDFTVLRHDAEMSITHDAAVAHQTLTLVVTIQRPIDVGASGTVSLIVKSAEVGGEDQTGSCEVGYGGASTGTCVLQIPDIAAGHHEVIGTWENRAYFITIGYRGVLDIAEAPTGTTATPAGGVPQSGTATTPVAIAPAASATAPTSSPVPVSVSSGLGAEPTNGPSPLLYAALGALVVLLIAAIIAIIAVLRRRPTRVP